MRLLSLGDVAVLTRQHVTDHGTLPRGTVVRIEGQQVWRMHEGEATAMRLVATQIREEAVRFSAREADLQMRLDDCPDHYREYTKDCQSCAEVNRERYMARRVFLGEKGVQVPISLLSELVTPANVHRVREEMGLAVVVGLDRLARARMT